MTQAFHMGMASALRAPIFAGHILNDLLWLTHGLITLQPYLFVPNATGVVLALLHIALCCMFCSQGNGCAPVS